MENAAEAAQTLGRYLQAFTASGGLRLRFRIMVRGGAAAEQALDGAVDASAETSTKDPAGTLYVEFSGPDTPVLTARNGELLHALEHLATKILRLEPEQFERLSFDADHFKANRDRAMRESAAEAMERVRSTGRPHPFPPMNSRERRMLHLILKDSGLPTASSGEGPGRFVVLYPAGADTSAPMDSGTEPPRRQHDAGRLRQAFRHR